MKSSCTICVIAILQRSENYNFSSKLQLLFAWKSRIFHGIFQQHRVPFKCSSTPVKLLNKTLVLFHPMIAIPTLEYLKFFPLSHQLFKRKRIKKFHTTFNIGQGKEGNVFGTYNSFHYASSMFNVTNRRIQAASEGQNKRQVPHSKMDEQLFARELLI